MIILFILIQGSFVFAEDALHIKCKQKDMYSCQKLGNLYKKEKNSEKSIYYYSLVCDNNLSDGCMALATYYDLNNRKYKRKAFEYYTKACALNNSVACNNLGNFYRYGKVVDKNSTRAINFFEKAYCLGYMNKPHRNRLKTIEENTLQDFIKDDINCLELHIDESMDTSCQIDDEVNYQ